MIIKCKMCGGDLNIQEGTPICECEFCGTQQTIPQADDEKKANLFNRANYLRMNAEFDKAASVYESIAAEFPTEAEAYWGLCLCAYGIEYVDDPATGEKKPTCHRTLTSSIMEDINFEQACDYADSIARRIYREEAKAIDRIQKEILSIVSSEKPYDVFICYKETAEEGGRTEDSVLAQDIYDNLTAKGLKVFFSRITLEDKLGQEYEPYIYAALSSAKVMLAVGTKFEYYDAVWVKNEWMRFLSMMKTEKGKTLIPCYKELDAYDMPKEFKNLQGQDLSKIGWLQDLTRGVLKLCGKAESAAVNPQGQAPAQNTPTIANLEQRAKLFLEDGEWEDAKEYLNRILDLDSGYAPAYIGLLQVNRKVRNEADLAKEKKLLSEDGNFQKALRFADDQQRERYEGYHQTVQERITAEGEAAYQEAQQLESTAESAADMMKASVRYQDAGGIRDAEERAASCRKRADELRAEAERAIDEKRRKAEEEEKQRIADEKRRAKEEKRRQFQDKAMEMAPWMNSIENLQFVQRAFIGALGILDEKGYLIFWKRGTGRSIYQIRTREDELREQIAEEKIKAYRDLFLKNRVCSGWGPRRVDWITENTDLICVDHAHGEMTLAPFTNPTAGTYFWFVDDLNTLRYLESTDKGIKTTAIPQVRRIIDTRRGYRLIVKTDGSCAAYSGFNKLYDGTDYAVDWLINQRNIKETATTKGGNVFLLDEEGHVTESSPGLASPKSNLDENWHDMQQIISNRENSVYGLRKDGKVFNPFLKAGQQQVSGLNDIIRLVSINYKGGIYDDEIWAISVDGKIWNFSGQTFGKDLTWGKPGRNNEVKVFSSLEQLQSKHEQVRNMPKTALDRLRSEQKALNEELDALHGIFTKKRRTEIETRLDEIKAGIKFLTD